MLETRVDIFGENTPIQAIDGSCMKARPNCPVRNLQSETWRREGIKRDKSKIHCAAMLPEERSILTVKIIIGTVAHGSIIHNQLQYFCHFLHY